MAMKSATPEAARRSALILIDIQNSFFHPDGGNYYAESRELIPNLRLLLETARKSKTPILFVAERHRPNLEDFESKKLPRHCVSGEFDSEFFEGFGPLDSTEFVIEKRRMSAFNATDLDLLLREKDVDRIVVAGVKTNVCVRATVQDAFSLGYQSYVPKGGVNSNRENLHAASLEDIERYLGWTVSVADAVEMLS
jgi:nicotinamidase-related amidase